MGCREIMRGVLRGGWAQYRKAGYQSLDVYARGIEVSPIDGGLFDVDQLVAVQ